MGGSMRYVLFAVAAAATLGGCSLQESRSTAEAAVTQFHQQLNAGQYQEIYRATAPEFKHATSEERFVAILAAIHDRFGAFGQADQQEWHVNYNNGVTSATLSYNTTFARGAATERFVYIIGNQGAALASYDINSPAVGTGPGAAPTPPPTPGNEAAPEGEGGK